MTDLLYTIIQHVPRKKWDLSVLEACAIDTIYQLSNNPKYNRCIKSKDAIAKDLGISRRTVFNIIDKLLQLWLVEKDEVTSNLRTTQEYYNEFVLECKNCTTSATQTVQKLHGDSAKIAPNNNSNNNSILSISKDIDKSAASTPSKKKKKTKKVTKKKVMIWWDPLINEMIDWIKTCCYEAWLEYAPGYNERKYVRNILTATEFGEAAAKYKKDRKAFVRSIVMMSWEDYVTTADTPQKIYKFWPTIINQWKKQQPNEAEKKEATEKEEQEARRLAAKQRQEQEAAAKRLAEEEAARKLADRNKKIEIWITQRSSEEIIRLKKEFEAQCNSVVTASLDKGYESAFVKPAWYNFLFGVLKNQG